jgi:hypothetical protein
MLHNSMAEWPINLWATAAHVSSDGSQPIVEYYAVMLRPRCLAPAYRRPLSTHGFGHVSDEIACDREGSP